MKIYVDVDAQLTNKTFSIEKKVIPINRLNRTTNKMIIAKSFTESLFKRLNVTHSPHKFSLFYFIIYFPWTHCNQSSFCRVSGYFPIGYRYNTSQPNWQCNLYLSFNFKLITFLQFYSFNVENQKTKIFKTVCCVIKQRSFSYKIVFLLRLPGYQPCTCRF